MARTYAVLACAWTASALAPTRRVHSRTRGRTAPQLTMHDYDYDVVIVGCGVGGHGAALHARSQGLSTAVLSGGDARPPRGKAFRRPRRRRGGGGGSRRVPRAIDRSARPDDAGRGGSHHRQNRTSRRAPRCAPRAGRRHVREPGLRAVQGAARGVGPRARDGRALRAGTETPSRCACAQPGSDEMRVCAAWEPGFLGTFRRNRDARGSTGS